MSLNVSSNRLDSLDATSVRWLKHTAAVTDLSGNPWKCECSALGETWRELRYKLTLNCVSPEDRRGSTWDMMETVCSDRIIHNMSSDVTPNTTTDTGPALSTTLIIVNIYLVTSTLLGEVSLGRSY